MTIIIVITVSISVYGATSGEQQTAPADSEDVVDLSDTAMDSSGVKAIAATITITLSASIGAIAMGFSISKSVESISRQPEAEDGIRKNLTLGLVFVETTIIYALVVAIMIIFVL